MTLVYTIWPEITTGILESADKKERVPNKDIML